MLPAAFFVPIIHEWVKARVSTALGDPTPRYNGFTKGNLLKYFEPIGFIFMLAFQVGWGQPVPTSAVYYKDKRKGILLTYLTPMVVNLMLGLFTAWLVGRFWPTFRGWSLSMQYINGIDWMPLFVSYLQIMVMHFALFNVGLALFNLIPVYPLAGSKLIQLIASPDTAMRMSHFEKPLQILLILALSFHLLNPLIFTLRNNLILMVM